PVMAVLPALSALCGAGYYCTAESFATLEASTLATDGPPLYPFKAIIPIAGLTLLFQGFVGCVYCVACLNQGDWPRRDKDVEEVDVDKLKDMVSAEDITTDTSMSMATQR